MARERTEISPPVRIHPSGSHVIVYLIEEAENILIVRVRHGREDGLPNRSGGYACPYSPVRDRMAAASVPSSR